MDPWKETNITWKKQKQLGRIKNYMEETKIT